MQEKIKTTEAKAKELKAKIDKVINKAATRMRIRRYLF
jgi:ribosomal protein L17